MAAYQYVYVMKGLNKTFPGGKQVLKDIWLSFFPGAKIGVLGLNGSGKSTLLRVMAGQDDNFTGEAWAAEGAKLGLLEQEPQLDAKKDVLGNVMDGAGEMARMLARFEEVSNAFSEPDADMDKLIAEQAELQEKIDAGNGWDLQRTVEIAMDALRCPPSDAEVEKLSGGERRRVALCRLLLSKPDLLLLDEPTNHLDAESVAWLERHLAEFPGTVVAVTHDRYFLDNVAGWILELDRGAGIPWEGNYTSWLKQKEQRLALEEKAADTRRRTLQRELEWMGQSAQARRTKSKARIAAYNQMVEEEQKATLETAQIVIPAGPRLGDHVIEAEKISKGFGDRLLIDDLSFNLPPGGIVGVIGPNGAGKTTLFKMITGQDKPDVGHVLGRPDGQAGLRRPEPRDARSPTRRCGRNSRAGSTSSSSATARCSSRAYCRLVQLQGRRPAEEGRPALGRRAQPRPPRQDAEERRQRAAARRTDQRPRRRHAARARRGAGRLRRLRRHHQP